MTAKDEVIKKMQEAVDRGVIHQDLYDPGWHRRIKLIRLDMNASCGCVLGQPEWEEKHGDFWTAICKLWVFVKPAVSDYRQEDVKRALDVAEHLGFTLDVEDDSFDSFPAFYELTRMWEQAIQERLERDAQWGL